mmetsp:Transcript_86508/g.249854  ORF Transcript_86508/g.249854 Transcript_86508/m.249854 type:complete len:181 (-) Transcript_86508:190-732(-)
MMLEIRSFGWRRSLQAAAAVALLPYAANAFGVVTPNLMAISPSNTESLLHLSPLDAFSNIILSDETSAISVDDEASAFTDQINFLDGPILTMLGVFGVVMVALIGLKLLTNQMDSAIEQVVVDFESTLETYYPQRYQKDIRPLLEGLADEERQQKLVQIMENFQRTDPEFMTRVQEKMKR